MINCTLKSQPKLSYLQSSSNLSAVVCVRNIMNFKIRFFFLNLFLGIYNLCTQMQYVFIKGNLSVTAAKSKCDQSVES